MLRCTAALSKRTGYTDHQITSYVKHTFGHISEETNFDLSPSCTSQSRFGITPLQDVGVSQPGVLIVCKVQLRP